MSFTGNKPIYALAAALAAVVIIVSIISTSAIGEMKASRDSIVPTNSAQELRELRDEISQLKNSIVGAGASTLSQNQQEKTLIVSGTASTTIVPDRLYISLGVTTESDTAQGAARMNAEAMDKVVKSVKDMGIPEKDVNTAYFNINPNYDYSTPPKLKGFTASNTITISTSLLNIPLGEIIDNAISAGANRVDSVYFAASPESSAKLWEQTIDSAVLDAKVKAEKILSPLNMKIIGVKSINPYDTGYPVYQSPLALANPQRTMGAVTVTTPILQGQQQFTVNVNVTFLIA